MINLCTPAKKIHILSVTSWNYSNKLYTTVQRQRERQTDINRDIPQLFLTAQQVLQFLHFCCLCFNRLFMHLNCLFIWNSANVQPFIRHSLLQVDKCNPDTMQAKNTTVAKSNKPITGFIQHANDRVSYVQVRSFINQRYHVIYLRDCTFSPSCRNGCCVCCPLVKTLEKRIIWLVEQ